MTAEQFEIELGKKLQKLREAKGKTQSEVAEELGLNSRETVKQWESWDRHIKARDLIKLSQYYGVSSDWLLGLTDDPCLTADQKAAATYLHLSDFATGQLAKAIVSEPYRSLFENIVKSGALNAILREIAGASVEIKKKEKALTDDNADVMEREVRHLQRDMCENVEAHLADITGRGAIAYKIKTIQARRKQESAFEEYKAKVEDALLWEEVHNGEHTED